MGIWSSAFKKFCRPLSRLTGSAWADKFRVVPPGTSPEPGPWRTSRTPYLKEPMDAATDRETEYVVLEFSSQLGKSEALLGAIGYYADQEPAPQLMLQPTVEMAEAFSKERIEPMFRYSPGLQGKLEDGKDGRGSAKKSSTTIRMKHYPGGYLALVGANSPAGLASRPIRVLLCDEVDRYGETKEGDPLKLAIQRTQNFANRKIVIVSTPTLKGKSKSDEWFLLSDQRVGCVKCPHCGHEHKLEWANVHWDQDDDGKDDPMTACMYCPACGAKERGPFKPDPSVLSSGRWIPSNPESKIRGYHCNALYSPWVNLHDLVQEWLNAANSDNRKGMMEFVNLKLGEPFEMYDDDGGNWGEHYDRRERYPKEYLPEGVLVLTAGVDVQRDRLECSIFGWGVGRESWGIRHCIIHGRPDEVKTWAQLDEVLGQRFKLKSGREIGIRVTFIDSGDGVSTNDVYRYTKSRQRHLVFSIKGRSGLDLPIVGRPTKVGTVQATLFVLGVDACKHRVMDHLDKENPGPGYVHFDVDPEAGFSENYFKQLTAEVWTMKEQNGKQKWEWVQIRKRNEALDCCVYATAAEALINPNYELLQNLLSKGPQEAVKKPARRSGTLSRGVAF